MKYKRSQVSGVTGVWKEAKHKKAQKKDKNCATVCVCVTGESRDRFGAHTNGEKHTGNGLVCRILRCNILYRSVRVFL